MARLRQWWACGVVPDVLWVVALSAFGWGALLAPGYFLKAHDAPHSVFYLLEFDKAFRDGSLYPRWGIDFALGYGYPLFSYYSPLAYYVAEVFHLLGVGLTDAVKMTYVLATVASGLAMYGFVRRLFGRGAGLLAAAVYLFVPYRLLDLYVRCSFAEYCAFVFLPLVLWAFLELIEAPSQRRVAWAALAYSGLILMHNATFLMMTPLLAVYCVFLLVRCPANGILRLKAEVGWKPTERQVEPASSRLELSAWNLKFQALLAAISAALLAFALSAVLLLPAVLERGYIAQAQWTQGSFNYFKHFTYPGQLLSPFWGYGYAGEGPLDDMSLQLGLTAVVLGLLGVVWRPRRERGQWVFFLLATVVMVLLMVPISTPLWRAVPLVSLVQFPWRLLILTAVTLAVTAGALVSRPVEWNSTSEAEKAPQGLSSAPSGVSQVGARLITPLQPTGPEVLVAVLCLVVVLASQSYALPQYTLPDGRSETEKAIVDFEAFYPPDRVGMTAWVREQPKTSPLVVEYLADRPLTRAHLLTGDGEVVTLRSGGASVEATVRSAAGATVQFYLYYFPGWEVRVDGQPVPTRPEGSQALLTVDVPAGEHRLAARFTDTPLGGWGQIVSALALAVAVGLILTNKTRRTQRQ